MQKLFSGDHAEIGPFQLAILILSLVILAALAVDTLYTLPGPIHHVIQTADLAVCILLFADFWARFLRAESRLEFLKWGWIDLLASIPTIDALRWGRLARVLRVIRLLRGIRSFQRVLTLLFANRLRGATTSLGLMAFLLVTFCSMAVLICEQGDGCNIKTGGDALWWSITTMTTVGYGDRFPVTPGGRIVGTILMVCGVGMFAALSGMIASLFTRGKDQKSDSLDRLTAQIGQMQQKLDQLNQSSQAPDLPQKQP